MKRYLHGFISLIVFAFIFDWILDLITLYFYQMLAIGGPSEKFCIHISNVAK